MPVSFRSDLVFAILLICPLLLYASTAGSPLYLGSWYLIGVPLVTLIPGLILRAPAMFMSGTTVAAITTLRLTGEARGLRISLMPIFLQPVTRPHAQEEYAAMTSGS